MANEISEVTCKVRANNKFLFVLLSQCTGTTKDCSAIPPKFASLKVNELKR